MCHKGALKESPAVFTLRHVVSTEDAQFSENKRPARIVPGVLFNCGLPFRPFGAEGQTAFNLFHIFFYRL